MPNPQSNPFLPGPAEQPDAYQRYLEEAAPNQTPEQQPSGWMGKTGKAAYFLDQFIRGAQAGSYRKQQRELAKQQQADQTLNTYLQILSTKDPAQAQQVANQIIVARGQQAMQYLDGADKGKGDKKNPVLAAMKNLGEGLLGGPVKKWEGYGDKMGEWAQQILNMPSKEQGFQNTRNALDQRIAQMQKANPNITQQEVLGDRITGALINRLQTYYPDESKQVVNDIKNKVPTPQERLGNIQATEAVKDITGATAGAGPPPATATPSGVLSTNDERRARALGYIKDHDVTLKDGTTIPAKQFTGGPLAGQYYGPDNKRIDPADIGKEKTTPQPDQIAPKDEVDNYTKNVLREMRSIDPNKTALEDFERPPENATNKQLEFYRSEMKDRINMMRQQRFQAEQSRRDAAREASEGNLIQGEDEYGKPAYYFRHRNGQVEKVNVDVLPKGTFAKLVAPVASAAQFATSYAKREPTGTEDEALMREYFGLLRSPGLRTSEAQVNMFRDSRGWMQGAQAAALHAKNGVWFSPEQRKNIINTIKDIAKTNLPLYSHGKITLEDATSGRLNEMIQEGGGAGDWRTSDIVTPKGTATPPPSGPPPTSPQEFFNKYPNIIPGAK